MSSKPLNLAVIIGSVREGRFGPVVANWLAEQATQHGQFQVELVDLADTDLPLVLGPEPPAIATTDQRPAAMAGLTAKLAAADAYLVVTPEYNHSFPASLKAAIDWHFAEWRAKPIGFASYGGQAGGLRAVEALRLVFAELHAVTVRDGVAFPNYWELFDEEGGLLDAGPVEEAAKTLLDQLVWWGEALRNAREAKPYLA
ncbi:NAD(P)H-dependent oxidoreductase [Actinosynnema sp. NPDC047251]|uniref:NADPH-dependent FMN reductase n=1 Tax=Saccharothrix espanaensis (strain ATCC 51144 / DSM 44229 / JCM 9112 / NBRC 15066 / NRRL 15764) TaxID=1179773 RepID=K0K347_SACES|nr:NAD(P)H-dependent oxidoreductase [Saccharothrix espanaensis]CCH32731.1 NADPH-dependent FMN reductase [Saccharothrix espanaensis DSM 44229]